MRTRTIISIALSGALLFVGCAGWNRTIAGGAIGATVGGVLGGVIGKQVGNTAAGAIIGAAVGGTAGAAIGRYMDKQAEEMRRDLEGAKIERVGEGIKITFASGILFDVGSSNLRSEAQANISDLSRILNKYKDTEVIIEGHTDSTGSDQTNLNLSENRSASVSRFIKSQGVQGARLTTVGYGEKQPIADNGNSSGRQANRRVEVAVFANDRLKRAARNGTI